MQQRQQDLNPLVKENEIGHKKEVIDQLYKNTKGVKHASEQIASVVDRLEQKRKVHDMAAHVLINIETLEKQQQAILKLTASENKQVMDMLNKGMAENTEMIKNNLLILKAKLSKQQ